MNGHTGAAQRGAIVGVGLAIVGVLVLAGSADSAVDSRKTAQPLRTSDDLTHFDGSAAATPVAAAATAAAVSAAQPSAGTPAAPAVAAVSAASRISGASIGTSDVLAMVKKYFPADQVGNAMAVSRCESGHRNAVGATNNNGTTDWGVFQLNDGGTLQGALKRTGVSYSSTEDAQRLALNAEVNVRAARSIFDGRGWQPWVCAYKVGVVAGLYSSAHGPMYGRYDELGLSNGGQLNLGTPVTASAPTAAAPAASASPSASPSAPPAPTPSPTPSTKPSASATPKPKPTPTPIPTPTPAPPVTPPPTAPAEEAAPKAPAPAAPPAETTPKTEKAKTADAPVGE